MSAELGKGDGTPHFGVRYFSITPAFHRRWPHARLTFHRDGITLAWHIGWRWGLLFVGTVTELRHRFFAACDARDFGAVKSLGGPW